MSSPRLTPLPAGRPGAARHSWRTPRPRLSGRLPAVLASPASGLQQRRDPHRIEAIEVEAAQGVAVADLDFLLQQDRSGIETLIGPEDAEPGPRLAHDDRPVDRAGTAVAREQRRMILDGAARGLVQHLLGHDERDVG